MTIIEPEVIKELASGSFEETKQKICDAILQRMGAGYDVYLKATFPDKVVARVYPYEYNPLSDLENKFYEIPYSIDGTGNVNIGEATEVAPETNYVQVSKAEEASNIVMKDDDKRLITSSVLLPFCDDCDAKRGEKQHTPEEIQSMMIGYMRDHRIVDKLHDYAVTKKDVGDVVECWQLRQDETHTNIFGVEKTFPKGTWMATTYISDDETWLNAKKGIYNSYSVTAIPKDLSDKLAEKGIAAKERVLIKDLKDPVGYTISLVPKGCVYENDFHSMKGFVEKAGQVFSSANSAAIQKAIDVLQGLLGKQTKADEAKAKNDMVGKEEELDMKKEDVGTMIDEKLNSMKEDIIKSIKEDTSKEEEKKVEKTEPVKLTEDEIKSLKEDTEAGNLEAYKKLVEAGEDVSGLQIKVEKMESFKELKEESESIKANVDELNEKLGHEPSKKSLEGDDEKKNVVEKTDTDFYKDAGLKGNGRPL
jgi:hypothetical protein